MSKTVRIVIAGGGTGGHVQPAVAVFQFLNETNDVKALWIGSHTGLEQTAATQSGILFTPIQTGKFRRYLSLQTPLDLIRIPIGIVQALRSLRRFRPDVVLSTGGFVSVPTVIAARILRIPSITHEQTATVGLATRINVRFASVVALTFEQSRTQLHKTKARVVVTGNPIRASLLRGSADAAMKQFNFTPTLPLIYVTGGALEPMPSTKLSPPHYPNSYAPHRLSTNVVRKAPTPIIHVFSPHDRNCHLNFKTATRFGNASVPNWQMSTPQRRW